MRDYIPEIYINSKNGISFTTSLDVAEKFGKDHAKVLRAIRNIIEEDEEFSQSNFGLRNYNDDRGKDQPMYRITRDGFSLLGMGFTGKKALEWKKKYIQAFNLMEQALLNQKNLDWQDYRAQGKIARREETDIIKAFAEYSTAQGSTHAHHYYKHLTNATYKALFTITDRFPGSFRDLLNAKQVRTLMVAEDVAADALKEGMNREMFYKDIYQFAKTKLEQYSKSVGQSAVVHRQGKQITYSQQSLFPEARI